MATKPPSILDALQFVTLARKLTNIMREIHALMPEDVVNGGDPKQAQFNRDMAEILLKVTSLTAKIADTL